MLKSCSPRFFATSLMMVAFMVLVMIVVGGLTRLTGSGLSMVDWKPLTGFIPPLTQADWLQEFQHYQQFPEYKLKNFGMSLEDFQNIFWLEFIHRVIGRLIGFVLLVPTLIAFLNPAFKSYRVKVLGLWVLGGLQGLMGWYMVKSGLNQVPWVSPYRLCAHLMLAFGLFAYILNLVFALLNRPFKLEKTHLLKTCLGASILTIILGAFTAGLHAGKVYNTFPKMGEYWLPPELFYLKPFWINIFEEPVTVQFLHRLFALSTFGLSSYLCYQNRHNLKLVFLLGGAITVQVLLGITTLLLEVPIGLAVAHQAWAITVFGTLFWTYLSQRKKSHVAVS